MTRNTGLYLKGITYIFWLYVYEALRQVLKVLPIAAEVAEVGIKATSSAIGNTFETQSTCLYNFWAVPVY